LTTPVAVNCALHYNIINAANGLFKATGRSRL
jgi:hypothetical protein